MKTATSASALDARARRQVEAVRQRHGEKAARLVAARLAMAGHASPPPSKAAKKRAPRAKGLGVPPIRKTNDPRFAWPLDRWMPSLDGVTDNVPIGSDATLLSFVVSGAPQPKQRAGRRRLGGGGVQSYNPPQTAAYEGRVRDAAITAMREVPWPVGGWRDPRVRYLLEVEFVLAIDRGDADNFVKSVKDALNGWAFPDDQRVAANLVTRRVVGPGGAPATRVSIYAVGPAACLADRVARPDPTKAPRAPKPKTALRARPSRKRPA